MINSREARRNTQKAAMAVRQTGETPESFTMTYLNNMVQYKRGPENRDKTSNNKNKLFSMYQA